MYFKNRNMDDYLTSTGLNLSCPVIAIDDGYDQMKIAYWVPTSKGNDIEVVTMASRAKRGKHIVTASMASVGLYTTSDKAYTVSDDLPYHEDTRSESYPKSELNRVLVQAALNRIGITNGQKVAIITGLPLDQYQREDKEVNTALIDAKKDNLKTPVFMGNQGDRPAADIVYQGILPEAISGLTDYMYGVDGELKPDMDGNISRMALDIGGNTTDMAVVSPSTHILDLKTIQYGVSHIRDRLKTVLESQFEIKTDSYTLDHALKTGELAFFEESHDVSKQVESACNDVLVDIFEAAEEFKKPHPRIRQMICFGGGAALCQKYIKKRFPKIIVIEEPDGANTRGFLKFASTSGMQSLIDGVGRLGNSQSAKEK